MSKLALWIHSLVTWQEYKFKEKKPPTKIDKVSKKNKNTVASFSDKTKAAIFARDKHCLFCDDPITDYHHVYYWWLQAEHWPDRNDVNKWVWLCRMHHEKIHHFTDWTSQILRQKCILYIERYYKWLSANIIILDDPIWEL